MFFFYKMLFGLVCQNVFVTDCHTDVCEYKQVNGVFNPFFHSCFQVLKPLDVKTKFYNAEVIFNAIHCQHV